MVGDELWDGAEIMLFCQIKLALWRGADVIMPAAPTSFPVERTVRATLHRSSQQILIRTGTYHVCIRR